MNMKIWLKIEGYLYFIGFIGSIFGANYLLNNVGVICPPDSPCLIPVGFGLYAPSAVIAVGISFTLRDLVQRRLGIAHTIIAIILGALISTYLSPKVAMASGVAFLLSEFLDLMVYTPIQEDNITAAVILSNIVGVVVDSVVFLWLAFGNLQYLDGQIVGKLWMTLAALPFIWFIHWIDDRRSLALTP